MDTKNRSLRVSRISLMLDILGSLPTHEILFWDIKFIYYICNLKYKIVSYGKNKETSH